MTREEAIQQLNIEKDSLRRLVIDCGITELKPKFEAISMAIEAIDMAIEALSAERITAWGLVPKDEQQTLLEGTSLSDTISRSDLIARLNTNTRADWKYSEIISMIKYQPSAHKPTDGDLIRREDAVKSVQENIRNWENVKTETEGAVVRAIINLPSAEAVQGWIPCSERLPNEDGQYLVFMDLKYYNMEVLKWAEGWNCHRGYDGKIHRESEIDGSDIIAWMPLPTPYKGGAE